MKVVMRKIQYLLSSIFVSTVISLKGEASFNKLDISISNETNNNIIIKNIKLYKGYIDKIECHNYDKDLNDIYKKEDYNSKELIFYPLETKKLFLSFPEESALKLEGLNPRERRKSRNRIVFSFNEEEFSIEWNYLCRIYLENNGNKKIKYFFSLYSTLLEKRYEPYEAICLKHMKEEGFFNEDGKMFTHDEMTFTINYGKI